MVKFSSLFLLERDERAFSVLVERTRVFSFSTGKRYISSLLEAQELERKSLSLQESKSFIYLRNV